MNQPLPDLHDNGELWEPSTGWLVCPTCTGDGSIFIGENAFTMECPDCNGTGDPPMRPVTPNSEENNAQT